MKKILLTTFALVVLSGCAHKQQTADEQQALENPNITTGRSHSPSGYLHRLST